MYDLVHLFVVTELQILEKPVITVPKMYLFVVFVEMIYQSQMKVVSLVLQIFLMDVMVAVVMVK